MTKASLPRTLPVRRWLVIALGVVFFLPLIVTGFVAYNFVFDGREQREAVATAFDFLRDGSARWSDPAWQSVAQSRLTAGGVDFVLFSGGAEIFRSTSEPLAGTSRGQDSGPPWLSNSGGRVVYLLQVPGSSPAQTAYIYEPMSDAAHPWILPLVAVSTLLVALTGIGWVVGRMVVRPLAATGRAARLFARGEMEAALPSSSVREIAEVNAAFEAMRAGLRESVQQQAELEQERRFLIGAVAHDLRTPLFSLRGYLEGLEQDVADTPEKRSRYVAVAQEKADTLERLISDLFDYTRLEYLELVPVREPLSLTALLRRLVDAIQPLAALREVRVPVEADGECIIDGDSHLLARAIENLLDNARRYTPAGGIIRVSCGREGDTAWFRITDSGPGIPPEDLPHLFAPLYRGETSRNRRTGGAGLGLTIARRILLAHGGDLSVENSPEGGAAFTGSLPAGLSGPT